MKVVCVAGFAPITKDPAASAALYREALGLPLKAMDEYLSVDRFDGTKHFGVWPLRMAAQSCFGQHTWPKGVPEPHATIEFELSDVEAVQAAVEEMRHSGQQRLLLVSFIERPPKVRIIGARRATRREREEYERDVKEKGKRQER
jgi:catechol 2,3-dioxygenase-like lactoylglutathione lyase family enzyme